MPIKQYTFIHESSYMATPNVRHIVLAANPDDDFTFVPGQFITVHFEAAGKMLRRSYSIASIPGQTDLIEIAASYVKDGPGTHYLYQLNPGDEVTISGPAGRLILREDEQPKRYVFIATGTGVTPYRSMLAALEQRFKDHKRLEVVVLLGVRQRDELLYGDDFIAFAKTHPRFHFDAFYSREFPADPQPYEHSGRVFSGFDELKPNPKNDLVYLCGNPTMIDEAFTHLKSVGFDPHAVRREKYISPAKPKEKQA